MLILRPPWTTQPQGVPSLSSAPITRGLVFLFNAGGGGVAYGPGGKPRALVTRNSTLTVKQKYLAANQGGRAMAPSRGVAYDLPVSLFSLSFGAYTGSGCDVSIAGDGDNYIHLGYASASGAYLRVRGSSIVDTTGAGPDGVTRDRWAALGATCTSSTSRDLYIDGRVNASTSGACVSAGMYQPAVGDFWRGSWGHDSGANVAIAAVWNRVLTPDEHLSLALNPWQLFAPRQIIIPLDAGGAVTHPSTGTLSAQAATLAGTAAHYLLHATTGTLSAQSSTLAGSAVHPHIAVGDLLAQAATMTGSSVRAVSDIPTLSGATVTAITTTTATPRVTVTFA